jgi:hypothetical protein
VARALHRPFRDGQPSLRSPTWLPDGGPSASTGLAKMPKVFLTVGIEKSSQVFTLATEFSTRCGENRQDDVRLALPAGF